MRDILKKYQFHIKVALLGAFIVYLYLRIDWIYLIEVIESDGFYIGLRKQIGLIILCLVGIVLNWFLEAVKWKLLISNKVHISYATAIKGVLMGIPLGMLTPQRIGEHGGRILAVQSRDNPDALSSSFWASVSQWIACLILGIVTLYYLPFIDDYFNIYIGVFLIVVFTVVLSYLMFKPERLNYLIPFSYKDKRWFKALMETRSEVIVISAIVLSLFRYLIFSFQFLILLYILGAVDLTFYNYILSIGVFVMQSFIPIPGLLSVATRTEIAVLVFASANGNETVYVVAAFLLWGMNLLIPSLVGMGIIFKENIKNSLIYENSHSSDDHDAGEN